MSNSPLQRQLNFFLFFVFVGLATYFLTRIHSHFEAYSTAYFNNKVSALGVKKITGVCGNPKISGSIFSSKKLFFIRNRDVPKKSSSKMVVKYFNELNLSLKCHTFLENNIQNWINNTRHSSSNEAQKFRTSPNC